MRFREILESMARGDLAAAEIFANRTFKSLNISVIFTNHFRERALDDRNKPAIKINEILRLFREAKKQHKKRLKNMSGDFKLLISDKKTGLNMIVSATQKDPEGPTVFACKTIKRDSSLGRRDTQQTMVLEAVGRITKQNQTADVGPQEIKTQAAKFGNTVDKDGRPPTLSKKTRGSKTNVLFNLGMAK